MRAFRKFQATDGRIKVATLSGVSALVAVIALLVGVLPVFASHSSVAGPLDEGGGPGKCFVETDGLPSIAGHEFHINNPTLGEHTSTDGVIKVTVYDTGLHEIPAGRLFSFHVVDSGFVVYDVVVNGGPKSLHYDYDAKIGAVSSDDDLHAPHKNTKSLHNLSHINICYDVVGLTSIPCDVDPPIREVGDGILTAADVTIFQNSLHDCTDKGASFFIEDDVATLEFLGDGTDIVAGRLDIYKDFAGSGDFVDLEYDGPGDFVPLQWCAPRTKDTTSDTNGLLDGDQFDDALDPQNELTASQTKYPSLSGVLDDPDEDPSTPAVQATACKVAEIENATGNQHTVVYFEFVDPKFQ